MVARWIATLDTYDFQIEHTKGASHGNADGLSRIPRRCCQREECSQCTQKQVGVVTRSQARGRDLADKGVASGTQRNAGSCSREEVPRVDPEVTSRGDATGKGKMYWSEQIRRFRVILLHGQMKMPLSLFSFLHSILMYREVVVVLSYWIGRGWNSVFRQRL